jgi:mRNA interferase MazF
VAAGPWRRWDLVLLNLEPATSSEQGRTRPALVVSNDGFNTAFPLLTVIPLTSHDGKRRRVYGFEVLLPERAAGNRRASIVMPHQMRTVSVARVLRRLGRLDDAGLRREIEVRILEHLAIGPDDA